MEKFREKFRYYGPKPKGGLPRYYLNQLVLWVLYNFPVLSVVALVAFLVLVVFLFGT